MTTSLEKVDGIFQQIRYAVNESGAVSQDSKTKIPAGAFVYNAVVHVSIGWSAGGTLEVGKPGTLSLLQATTDNTATAPALYPKIQDTNFGAADVVRTTNTAGAGPTNGVAEISVFYAIPLP